MDEKKMQPGGKCSFGAAVILLIITVVILMFGIIGCSLDPHIPILFVCGVVAIYGVVGLKIPWVDLRDSMVNSAATALEVMIIIFCIGATVGSWISSGTVPMIIYYGLEIFSPKFFFVSILVICAIMSMVTGSSWTTMGTVGVAFMGVGAGLGLNPAMTAGCIACGAFFGDKQSPVSDSTNFAAAVGGTDLYKHVKSMLYTTGPALIVSAVIFTIMGFQASGSGDTSTITAICDGLNAAYNFNIILIVPLILMIVMIVVKFPAIPTMMVSALMGLVCTVLFQGESFATALSYLYSGYVGNTGNEMIDKLITRGGMSSMYYTVALMICSLSMAGLFERTGMMDALMSKLDKITNTRAGLIITNLFSSYILSFLAADPYLAMLLPANAFGPKYDELGIDRSVCSRTLEDGGTLVCPMVPWGTSGVYTAVTLGVATTAYLPYYLMGYITPIFSIICAITGFGVFKAEKSESK